MSRELLISILNQDYCRIPENLRNDIESELENNKPVAWLTIDSRNNNHVHLERMSDQTLADWNIKEQLPLYTHMEK